MARRLTPEVTTMGCLVSSPVTGSRVFSCVYVQAPRLGILWMTALWQALSTRARMSNLDAKTSYYKEIPVSGLWNEIDDEDLNKPRVRSHTMLHLPHQTKTEPHWNFFP